MTAALLFGFCVAAYRFSLVSPALLCYALCLGTILFRPVSYRSVPLRYALFLVPYRLVSFRRSSHAAPFIFNLRLTFSPRVGIAPLYFFPHRLILPYSGSPCISFRTVRFRFFRCVMFCFFSFCLVCSAFFRASFRILLCPVSHSPALRSAPDCIVLLCFFSLLILFCSSLFLPEAPSRISFL